MAWATIAVPLSVAIIFIHLIAQALSINGQTGDRNDE
jgi:hypothetical protein